jgi:hypothetical protein
MSRRGAILASAVAVALAGEPAPALEPAPPPIAAHAGATRCAVCHTADGWTPARFPHENTGFPLTGRHARASCKACHPVSFREATGRECAACHRDPHAGISGRRCGACHDAESWRPTFDADVHRRTNFPLQGRHALIPCEECHGDRRDRAFARPAVQCVGCHQEDFTRAAGAALDHSTPGFSTSCRDCHTWWRFSPAYLPQHEACFAIASGPHAGIRCLSCHTALAGASLDGTCSTGTANCIRCHDCARHPAVPGFQCTNPRCYECHRFGPIGALRLRKVTR